VAELVPAAVFLAAKVEEHPRKLRELLEKSQETGPLAIKEGISETDGRVQRERVFTLERIILQTLCFDLAITHPYRFVFRLVKQLSSVPDELVQSAWIVVNDSFRTSLCIRFEAETIAVGAIHLAAERSQLHWDALQSKGDVDPLFGQTKTAVDGKVLSYPFVVEVVAVMKRLYSGNLFPKEAVKH